MRRPANNYGPPPRATERSFKPNRNRYSGRTSQARPQQSRPNGGRSGGTRGPDGPGLARRFFTQVARVGKFVCSGVFILSTLGVISAGLIIGYWYLVNSDYFMVRRVILEGLIRVTRDEVVSRAGLDKPVNILALRLGDVTEQVRGLPWVDTVSVARQLPDTITIQIKERRPRTLISLGNLYYLDDRGRPFKMVDPKEKPELPIITGFAREDFDSPRQEHSRTDIEEVFSLLDVVAERNDNFRVENISEINFDQIRGLSLFTRDDNVQVKIGLGDYRAKFRRLGRVLAHLKIKGQAEHISYINLESGPRVIVRRTAKS